MMTEIDQSPYICHVFMCTNDRDGKRPSCADGGSPAIWSALKDEISKRGWKKQVRISQSGCMGLCGKGPNVIIYPRKIWFSKTSPDDVDQIVKEIDQILAQDV